MNFYIEKYKIYLYEFSPQIKLIMDYLTQIICLVALNKLNIINNNYYYVILMSLIFFFNLKFHFYLFE